jgi:hypothetical protein
VIVPFGDHEEIIGAACRRVAEHLRQQQVSFEILAVDEDSTDNSHAILALLRREIPELRLSAASGLGRGFGVGATQAQGRALLLIEPAAVTSTVAAVGRAVRRVLRRELDLAVVSDRFAVAHRTQCLAALQGPRVGDFRRLARRARSRGLSVETYDLGGSSRTSTRLGDGRLFRLLEALSPARSRAS